MENEPKKDTELHVRLHCLMETQENHYNQVLLKRQMTTENSPAPLGNRLCGFQHHL